MLNLEQETIKALETLEVYGGVPNVETDAVVASIKNMAEQAVKLVSNYERLSSLNNETFNESEQVAFSLKDGKRAEARRHLAQCLMTASVVLDQAHNRADPVPDWFAVRIDEVMDRVIRSSKDALDYYAPPRRSMDALLHRLESRVADLESYIGENGVLPRQLATLNALSERLTRLYDGAKDFG